MDNQVRQAHETLLSRVEAVAGLHNRCALVEGAGRFCWNIGAPLLAVLLAQAVIGLPLLLRVAVLPLLVAGVVWCGWRGIIRPLLNRCGAGRAAMLIETAWPRMQSRIISALQLYPELEKDKTWFDGAMLSGLVLWAQESTANEDFGTVIDRQPARRAAIAAAVIAAGWLIVFAVSSDRMLSAVGQFGSAWKEARQIALRATGAKIVIEKLDRSAYLRGSTITIRARQKGFRADAMEILIRQITPNGADGELRREPVKVDADGRAQFTLADAQQTFECSFQAGRIVSDQIRAIVTEPPRIAKLSVEYDLPAYVRRAPIVQPRSDGNLKSLYGGSILLTIEANKNIKTATLSLSYAKKPEPMSVGGQFAQGSIQLTADSWLHDKRAEIAETYKLRLTDEYGFVNEDADQAYALVITKDQPPSIEFTGLPHRSSADEPHIPEKDLDRIGLSVRGQDDYGIAKVTLHYRIEDLETGKEKGKGSKPYAFGLPPTQTALSLARAPQLGLTVGDRLVFWAEAEDAYDLDPQAGPHKSTTPPYRMAIVTEEQLFR
ncbi:MAG TPA: hypothetical protein VM223_20725, partial [Planctomycetota bacterium]|nr:hypothetical protein [Planctomycetota bacterium]